MANTRSEIRKKTSQKPTLKIKSIRKLPRFKKQDVKKGGAGTTTERPKPITCDCNNNDEVANGQAIIYTASGLANLQAPWPTSVIKISISSLVVCDAVRKQCKYTFTATTEVQDQASGKVNPNVQAFVKKFKVFDSVNEQITPDRVDQTNESVVTWNPNSPNKESTKVTLVIVPSTRGGTEIEITERPVTICVPTGPVAKCPVK